MGQGVSQSAAEVKGGCRNLAPRDITTAHCSSGIAVGPRGKRPEVSHNVTKSRAQGCTKPPPHTHLPHPCPRPVGVQCRAGLAGARARPGAVAPAAPPLCKNATAPGRTHMHATGPFPPPTTTHLRAGGGHGGDVEGLPPLLLDPLEGERVGDLRASSGGWVGGSRPKMTSRAMGQWGSRGLGAVGGALDPLKGKGTARKVAGVGVCTLQVRTSSTSWFHF